MKPQKILLPVDFSYHVNGAVRLATMLARRWSAEIVVLHVDPMPGAGTVAIEPIYIAPQMFDGLHAEHDAKVEQRLREMRDEVAERAGKGVKVTAVRRRSEPVAGIITFARELGADLMIMGSQGASGIAHLLLGSTAEKVSREAPCPVLIAGRIDDTREETPAARRVIVAVDYSDFSAPAARLAALFVAPGGVLELVHIANEPLLSALQSSLGGQRPDLNEIAEKVRESRVQQMDEFAAGLGIHGVEVIHYIGGGTPAGAILARAEDTSADLIVLGAHSRTGLGEKILGTVADRVLRHAQAPVLLYPAAALHHSTRSAGEKANQS